MSFYEIDYTTSKCDDIETYTCESECFDFAIDELEGEVNAEVFVINWKILK